MFVNCEISSEPQFIAHSGIAYIENRRKKPCDSYVSTRRSIDSERNSQPKNKKLTIVFAIDHPNRNIQDVSTNAPPEGYSIVQYAHGIMSGFPRPLIQRALECPWCC